MSTIKDEGKTSRKAMNKYMVVIVKGNILSISINAQGVKAYCITMIDHIHNSEGPRC